jgi:hypothetical protein
MAGTNISHGASCHSRREDGVAVFNDVVVSGRFRKTCGRIS